MRVCIYGVSIFCVHVHRHQSIDHFARRAAPGASVIRLLKLLPTHTHTHMYTHTHKDASKVVEQVKQSGGALMNEVVFVFLHLHFVNIVLCRAVVCIDVDIQSEKGDR